MGKCETTITSITIDLSDDQLTHVTVRQTFEGDCPVPGLKGIYRKAFPARLPVVDLFTVEGGIKDYLLW